MNLTLSLQFPIKIVSGEIPIDDIRDDLIKSVTARAVPGTSSQRSSIGNSWRSSMELHVPLTTGNRSVETLVARVRTFTDACVDALHVDAKARITECWLNELGPGAYNSPHDHFPYHWSGVLWLDAEHEPETDSPAGNIELMSPYASRAFGQQNGSVFVRPVNGLAVFFPAGLKHMVHPTTIGKRISLAWNCNVETNR